jgi:Cysteine-rich CWC
MKQSLESVDPKRCPLCGNDNACGMEAGKKACWCADVSIRKEVLDRLPSQMRGVACVCESCARNQTAR